MDIIIYVIIIFIVAFFFFGGTLKGKLSYQQLVDLAKNDGFTYADANIDAAIALAESKGNPLAYNPEINANTPPFLGSYGLWQIYLKAHPEFAGQNLYDQQTNANAAFDIYTKRGNSFKDWSTYNNGDYQSYIQF